MLVAFLWLCIDDQILIIIYRWHYLLFSYDACCWGYFFFDSKMFFDNSVFISDSFIRDAGGHSACPAFAFLALLMLFSHFTQ